MQERVRGLEHIRTELMGEVGRLRNGNGNGNGVKLEEEEEGLDTLLHMEHSLVAKEKLIATLHDQIQQLEAALLVRRRKI